MRINKKYRISIEDQTSLEKRVDFSARLPMILLVILALAVVAGAFGMFILVSTPMKNYLPGYLKESERTATEEQHLRLDSLSRVYEVNEAYINGILNALNPQEAQAQKQRAEKGGTTLSADSLMKASDVERQFMEDIRERDKYNISYASPAAAQTMMFGSVNKNAVISQDSKNKYQADIILPEGSSVAAIAEGKVISVASSPRVSGAYEVIIQHPKGFLSKSSRITNLTVKPGDRVAPGQIIATGSTIPGMKNNHMIFELWHDGDPLIPAQYLNGGQMISDDLAN